MLKALSYIKNYKTFFLIKQIFEQKLKYIDDWLEEHLLNSVLDSWNLEI